MERKEWIDSCRRLFTSLVKDTLWADFVFPAGGRAEILLGTCYDKLCKRYLLVSEERMTDFCICQIYAIAGFGEDYRRKWNVSHSFGDKAITRYASGTEQCRWYEDKWLKSYSLSRQELMESVKNHREHPFEKFIYPEYEETTKHRKLSTEVGYIICGTSTMLWTPFSRSCRACTFQDRCQKRTAGTYPELYRIRCEAWKKEVMR